MKLRTAIGLAAGAILCLLLLGRLLAWLNADRIDFAWGFVRTKVLAYHLEYDRYPRTLTDPRFQASVKKDNVSVVPVNGTSVYAVRHQSLFRRHKVSYIQYDFVDAVTPPVITAVPAPGGGSPQDTH